MILYPCSLFPESHCYECDPYLNDTKGICLSCESGYFYYSSTHECKKCNTSKFPIIYNGFERCESYYDGFCDRYTTYCRDLESEEIICPEDVFFYNTINKLCHEFECQKFGLESGVCTIENKKYITVSDFENISFQLKSEMKDFENYTKDYYKNFYEDLIKNVNKKMDLEEAKLMLNQKVDNNTFQKMINSKSSSIETDNIKITLTNLTEEIKNKISIEKFDSFIESISSNIQEIKNDLVLKGNIDEIMSYLKNKANIDDVNKALVEIHSELDSKSSLEDFNHAMNNQNSINTYLARENSIAKYIWKNGNVSKGYAVPWEEQIINTMPENIIWEKNDIYITIKKKGIYLISLGFFVEEKPTIQVMINGESVLSQVNSNAFIVRQDNSKELNLKNFGKLEDSEENGYNCITGLTMNEFLCLGNMSKIVISYSGSNSVKGMMSIKQICNI